MRKGFPDDYVTKNWIMGKIVNLNTEILVGHANVSNTVTLKYQFYTH